MKDPESSIQRLIVWLIFVLGAILLIGGLIAAFQRLEGQTEITLFGQQLSSGAVGVVLVFIGVVMVVVTIRDVLRSLRQGKPSISEQPAPTQVRRQVTGGIDQPRPGEAIERSCKCAGWAKDVEPSQHLWLAVEAGGFVWPKEGDLHLDGNNLWRTDIFEDGGSQQFSLSLYIANKDAHQQILDWLQTGHRTGSYPELKGIPGTQRLPRIDRLTVRT